MRPARSGAGSRSLQRQVGLLLSAAIAVAVVSAAIVSFGIAFYETKELQDAQLAQISQWVAQQPVLPTSDRFIPRDDEDAESHLVVKRLGLAEPITEPEIDVFLPASLSPGLQTLVQSGVSWRIEVAETRRGERFAVAQRMTVRDEIARDGALIMLLPLILLLPLLLLFMRTVLRSAFSPLAELTHTVDLLGEQSLVPLATDAVPAEALGLVQAVNRLLERLASALAQQRRLISGAAHELRTPITALMIQADNLANVDMPAAARERLEPLQQGLTRIAALLEQLLGLARVQGSLGAMHEDVDLLNLVRGVVEASLPMAGVRGVDLGCVRLEACAVRGDLLSVMALVRNAVDNAIKYTPCGGKVDVSAYLDGPMCVVVVEDNGPGIPNDERERVFEPFVRLLGTREVGSGLGLAIARDAARALGGAISLSDRLDGASGLRFVYVQAQHTIPSGRTSTAFDPASSVGWPTS